jgi:hypothetical protein
LRPRATSSQTTEQVEAARRDMNRIWRRLQSYTALGWWRQE